MPVNLPCVGTTDDRHQDRVGCVSETSETSVDTDRNVDQVSSIKIDRALLLAIQPENLPSTLYRDENFLSRVPVQREAANSYGLPPRMARSKLGGRFRTEGILVREADGAWVNFNCPCNSMPSFFSWISVPDKSRRALLVRWLSH
jgi:hypothetical protein